MPEAVVNTSPLQYLYQAEHLDLLRALYGQVVVPEAVVRELEAGRARGIVLPDVAGLPWISVSRVRNAALLPLASDLGAGEREVLGLAVETPDSLAVLDDALARQYARLLKITFTGTLGVLLKAKHAGSLGAVAPVIEKLEALRFHLDANTRAVVLKLAGELP